MKKPFIKISNHHITGKPRGIQLRQVAYLDYDLDEAKLEFQEVPLDEKDQPINDPTVAVRNITRMISNQNKVTQDGIMITKETFPIQEGESEEDYEARFNTLLENSIPEFDFWMSLINWESLILQGITMMDNFKSFDRP